MVGGGSSRTFLEPAIRLSSCGRLQHRSVVRRLGSLRDRFRVAPPVRQIGLEGLTVDDNLLTSPGRIDGMLRSFDLTILIAIRNSRP